jgi:hypothetical protein
MAAGYPLVVIRPYLREVRPPLASYFSISASAVADVDVVWPKAMPEVLPSVDSVFIRPRLPFSLQLGVFVIALRCRAIQIDPTVCAGRAAARTRKSSARWQSRT